MADPDAVDRTLLDIVNAHKRLDVWVNCAAVFPFGGIEEVKPDAFLRALQVH